MGLDLVAVWDPEVGDKRKPADAAAGAEPPAKRAKADDEKKEDKPDSGSNESDEDEEDEKEPTRLADMRVGGYGAVQRLRKQLVEATIDHCTRMMNSKKPGDPIYRDALNLLKPWVTEPKLPPKGSFEYMMAIGQMMMMSANMPGCVQYQTIEDQLHGKHGLKAKQNATILHRAGVLGCYLWTQHSDSDGEWPHGECALIRDWMRILQKSDSKKCKAVKDDVDELLEVFDAAASKPNGRVLCQ